MAAFPLHGIIHLIYYGRALLKSTTFWYKLLIVFSSGKSTPLVLWDDQLIAVGCAAECTL